MESLTIDFVQFFRSIAKCFFFETGTENWAMCALDFDISLKFSHFPKS